MTEKEAIETLQEMSLERCEVFGFGCGNCNDCRATKAYDTAIKALEKRIPKKPYDVDTEYKTFDCPECLSKLYADEDVQDCGYCCVCGQALDWGEEECGS